MRAAAPILLACLAAPGVAGAGQVPDPVLWSSEAEFAADAGAGQFVDRIELHLVQYATDPGWRSEWAARRYVGGGLLGAWGSTTGTELATDSQIALNVFPAERFQIRYDRREWADGRFEISDQRLDALWYPGRRWAVALCGWPAFEKEYSSIGLGLRVGAPRDPRSLEVRVLDERFVWNAKSEGGIQFTARPWRIVADGFWEGGPWRVRGSVDAGLEWAVEDRSAGGPTSGASARGWQRSADLEAELLLGPWSASARLTGAAFRRAQADASGAEWRLDRAWGRALLSLRRDLGRWSGSALAGWASQRDDFSSPGAPNGAYEGDAALLGLEAGFRPVPELTLRLGYLGSAQRDRRTAGAQDLLPDREDDAYLDKAHVRASWAFGPRMAFEALLSQALRGGEFGGGSVKAIVTY